MSWLLVLPVLAALVGAFIMAKHFDLRRLDDSVVTVFWFATVLWVIGLGLGSLYPRAPQLELSTVLLVLLGYAALIAGAEAAYRTLKARMVLQALVPLAGLRSSRQSTRLLFVTVFVGYSLVAIFVVLSGGVPVLQPDGEQARVDARAGVGYLVIAAVWLITLPTAALAASHELHVKPLGGVVVLTLVGVSLVALAGLGNRAPVLVLAMALGWMFLTRSGSLPPWRLIVGGALVAMAFLAVGAILRAGESMSVELVVSRSLWITYVNASNLQRLAAFIPHTHDYLLGMGHAMDFAVLLPGPQPNFATWLKQAMDLQFAGGGLTVGLIGEMYANWGPVIAVGSMAVLGFALPILRPRLRVHDTLDRAFVILLAFAVGGIVQSGVVSVVLYQIAPLTALYAVLKYAQSRLSAP